MWKQSPHAVQSPETMVNAVAASQPIVGAGFGIGVGDAVVGATVGGGLSSMQIAKPSCAIVESEKNEMLDELTSTYSA